MSNAPKEVVEIQESLTRLHQKVNTLQATLSLVYEHVKGDPYVQPVNVAQGHWDTRDPGEPRVTMVDEHGNEETPFNPTALTPRQSDW